MGTMSKEQTPRHEFSVLAKIDEEERAEQFGY